MLLNYFGRTVNLLRLNYEFVFTKFIPFPKKLFHGELNYIVIDIFIPLNDDLLNVLKDS